MNKVFPILNLVLVWYLILFGLLSLAGFVLLLFKPGVTNFGAYVVPTAIGMIFTFAAFPAFIFCAFKVSKKQRIGYILTTILFAASFFVSIVNDYIILPNHPHYTNLLEETIFNIIPIIISLMLVVKKFYTPTSSTY